MGGACGKRQGQLVYRSGLTPREFYEQKLENQLAETYEVFGLTEAQGKRFFDYFVAIDADGGGTVDQEEFHEYFHLTMTPFSERVYGALDLQDTGELNFQQFLIGVWNLNTLDHESLVKYIFDIFDADGGGELDIAEVDALCRMLYNTEETADNVKEVIKAMDTDGDGTVSLGELVAYSLQYPDLLKPAIDLQATLRKDMFGTSLWKRLSKRRKKLHGAEKSVMDILLTLRVEQKKRRKTEAAQKAAEDETKAAEEKRKAEEEAEAARKEAEDTEMAKQAKETPAQTALRLATDELDEARDMHSAMQHEIDPSRPKSEFAARKAFERMSMLEKAKLKAREKAALLKKKAQESGMVETKAVWEMTPEERKAHELKLAGKDPASLVGASRPEPTFEQREELDKRMRRVKAAVNAYFEADKSTLAEEKIVAMEKVRTDTATHATKFFTTDDGQKLMKMLVDDELRIMGTGGTASQRMAKAKEQALENYVARKTREAIEDSVEQYKVKTDMQHAAHMARRDEVISELEEEATIVASWGWVEMVDEESQTPYYFCEATTSSLWTPPIPNLTSKCFACKKKLIATLRCVQCATVQRNGGELCHECDPTVHFGNTAGHERYAIEEEELRWRRLRRRFDQMLKKSKKKTSLPILSIDFGEDAR
jgi:serine/threonine-protein phosphatase 2B regulatory subunit